jgi:hypothetical protein
MRKSVIAVAVAAVLRTPEASGANHPAKDGLASETLRDLSASADIGAGARSPHPHQAAEVGLAHRLGSNRDPAFR